MHDEYTVHVHDPWLIALIAVGSFLVFGVLWIVIGRVIARFSGWTALAAKYPRPDEPAERRWRFRSGRMGRMKISLALTIGASPRFLYLSIVPGLVGFKPIAVPWEQLELVDEGRWRARLRVRELGTELVLPAKVWRAAQDVRAPVARIA